MPKVAELEVAQPGLLTCCFPRPPDGPDPAPNCIPEYVGIRPEKLARRVQSPHLQHGEHRDEIGIIFALRVFSLAARIVSSRRSRLTSFHCNMRISPSRQHVSSRAIITARRWGLAAASNCCPSSSRSKRLSRVASFCNVMAGSVPILNGSSADTLSGYPNSTSFVGASGRD